MIRKVFMSIMLLAFCLFTANNFTIAIDEIESESNSDMGMGP